MGKTGRFLPAQRVEMAYLARFCLPSIQYTVPTRGLPTANFGFFMGREGTPGPVYGFSGARQPKLARRRF